MSVPLEDILEARELYERSLTLLQNGSFAEAIPLCQRIVQLTPHIASRWTRLGWALTLGKRHEEAIVAYETATALDSTMIGAWRNLAMEYILLQKYQEALAAADRACSLMTNGHPQEGRPAYVYRSLALLNLGRLEDALTSTDELLSFIPYTRGAWFQRGHTLVRMLRFRDAEEAYRRGIELEPENAAGLRELINLYRLHMRDYAQAETCCEQLIALHPDDGANWKLKGDILFRRENYQDAESAYERALALCATDATITADVWHNYGSTLILLGRYDKALVAFDKGDAIAHAGYTSLNGRGVIMSRIERPLDALAWYEAALRLEPSIQVQSNKAEALARLGRLDEAEEIVNNILAGEPKAMGAGVVRGIVETYRERHAEAMIAFTSALALDPRHAPSYIEFARLLLVLSAADHARRVIERALALDPYDASAWQVKGQALRALGLLEEANAAEKHGATLLADQQAQVDAWLRERAQRGEPAGPR